MIIVFHQSVGKAYPMIAGAIFLTLGLVTLVHPGILSHYSIYVEGPSARIASRAMIGGGEIGLGFLLLAGRHFSFSSRQRSLIAAVIFICVGLVRLLAGWSEGMGILLGQPLHEAVIEIILGVTGFWASKNSENYQKSNG